GHPQAREQRRCHYACQLASDLTLIAAPPCDAQHADVTSHVQPRAALTEDVRALQMMKRSGQVTGIAGSTVQRPLPLKCVAYHRVHDLTTRTSQGATDRP